MVERDLPAPGLNVSLTAMQRFWAMRARFHDPNLGKRQVKAPEINFRDTGLLHEQLGIADEAALWLHPRSGASCEGVVIEQVLALAAADPAYLWATHAGAELDPQLPV